MHCTISKFYNKYLLPQQVFSMSIFLHRLLYAVTYDACFLFFALFWRDFYYGSLVTV